MIPPNIDWPRRTARLTLRPVRPDDLDQLFRINTDPDVTRWLITIASDFDEFRAAKLASRNDPDDFSTVIEVDGVVIGEAFLEYTEAGVQRVAGAPDRQHSEAMIGYLLDPAHAGRGYATEVAAELLRLAFTELGVRRVTAGCFADNAASIRVLEKNGLRREQYGVADSWHAELGWIDGCTYAILADEWRARV